MGWNKENEPFHRFYKVKKNTQWQNSSDGEDGDLLRQGLAAVLSPNASRSNLFSGELNPEIFNIKQFESRKTLAFKVAFRDISPMF